MLFILDNNEVVIQLIRTPIWGTKTPVIIILVIWIYFISLHCIWFFTSYCFFRSRDPWDKQTSREPCPHLERPRRQQVRDSSHPRGFGRQIQRMTRYRAQFLRYLSWCPELFRTVSQNPKSLLHLSLILLLDLVTIGRGVKAKHYLDMLRFCYTACKVQGMYY
jgi:hypothetical protein